MATLSQRDFKDLHEATGKLSGYSSSMTRYDFVVDEENLKVYYAVPNIGKRVGSVSIYQVQLGKFDTSDTSVRDARLGRGHSLDLTDKRNEAIVEKINEIKTKVAELKPEPKPKKNTTEANANVNTEVNTNVETNSGSTQNKGGERVMNKEELIKHIEDATAGKTGEAKRQAVRALVGQEMARVFAAEGATNAAAHAYAMKISHDQNKLWNTESRNSAEQNAVIEVANHYLTTWGKEDKVAAQVRDNKALNAGLARLGAAYQAGTTQAQVELVRYKGLYEEAQRAMVEASRTITESKVVIGQQNEKIAGLEEDNKNLQTDNKNLKADNKKKDDQITGLKKNKVFKRVVAIVAAAAAGIGLFFLGKIALNKEKVVVEVEPSTGSTQPLPGDGNGNGNGNENENKGPDSSGNATETVQGVTRNDVAGALSAISGNRTFQNVVAAVVDEKITVFGVTEDGKELVVAETADADKDGKISKNEVISLHAATPKIAEKAEDFFGKTYDSMTELDFIWVSNQDMDGKLTAVDYNVNGEVITIKSEAVVVSNEKIASDTNYKVKAAKVAFTGAEYNGYRYSSADASTNVFEDAVKEPTTVASLEDDGPVLG